MHSLFCKSVAFYIKCNQSLTLYRYVRNASKRVEVLKTLKDFKVKNATDVEDNDIFVDYKDMAKRIKENDLDIEETFTKGEDWEQVICESSKLHDIHIREEKEHKRFAKKHLIGRKYFKDKKETNLLTHAAKQQIRYLHSLDPANWTPETLAKSFPTSITGVKKLLKSNFVLSSPERIKEHDDDVRRKWEILMSGEPSDAISFYTRCLWNDGTLLRENYNGNPNLPQVVNSTPQKITKVIKQNTVGEYAKIVQKYVEYKARKESPESCNSELTVKSEKVNRSEKLKPDREIHNIRKKSKLILDDKNNNTGRKEKQSDEIELPFNQFKENLRQELSFRSHKSPTSKQYYQWIEQDLKENDIQNSKTSFTPEDFSSEILKYNKEGIEIKRDRSHKNNPFYLYNNKLGYQYPKGKTVKGKIRVPASLQKKNSVYKVGQCVYDEDGEFLYKLP